MDAGYFLPLDSRFRLVWIWWFILLAFQQVLYYENNLRLNWLTTMLIVVLIIAFYFLVRQRRFFVSENHLYFTKDFRLKMLNIDLSTIMGVRISNRRLSFVYKGKIYHYIILGQSNRLIQELLKENDIAFTSLKKEKN